MNTFLIAVLFAAAAPWNLKECTDYALEHNISVKQSALAVEQKKVDLNTAEGRRLPGVQGMVGENLSFGRGLTSDNTYSNNNTTSTSFSLGADVPVFQGFDIKRGIQLGRLDLEAATVDLEKARDDVRIAVAKAYVQILFNDEMRRVAGNQVSVDSLQLERLRAMQAAGKASAADVSAQRATLAQSRLSAVQADNNLRLAVLDLTQLLELGSPEGFAVACPSDDKFEIGLLPNPEQIFAEAVEVKPQILADSLRLEYAGLNIRRAKGAFLPSLSVSGGLGTDYYSSGGVAGPTFGDQMRRNFSQYVRMNLTIPIFNRFSTRNSVRSAEINYNDQVLRMENTRKSLYKEIQQAYYNAVASQAKYASSRDAAESARQSFDLTREKYENGKSGITEYNEAKNRWMEAESNFLQARYECLYQTGLLDFYRGKELDF